MILKPPLYSLHIWKFEQHRPTSQTISIHHLLFFRCRKQFAAVLFDLFEDSGKVNLIKLLFIMDIEEIGSDLVPPHIAWLWSGNPDHRAY